MQSLSRLVLFSISTNIIRFLIPLFILNMIFCQSICINEFMASNVTNYPEIVDFDDYSDWIELYNNGFEDINLENYNHHKFIKFPIAV